MILRFQKNKNTMGKCNLLLYFFFLILCFFIYNKDVYGNPDSAGSIRPKIYPKLLPYNEWTEEYKDYFQRHYHNPSLTLEPKAIVLHYTGGSSFSTTYNIFKNGQYYDDGDVGTIFGHLSVHYIIDSDGTIYQTLNCNKKCRGAYGVNNIAISIEIVASNEKALLNEREAISSSFKLVKFLMTYFNIPLSHVWGHYEVSDGKYSKNKALKKAYTDYGDSRSPDCYPAGFLRTDPGQEYMKELRTYLKGQGF